MPMTRVLPVGWYNTPNIHHLTIDDFRAFCAERGIAVERCWFLNGDRLTTAAAANFRAEQAIFLLERRSSGRGGARKSVVEGKSVAVRVDPGGRRINKKKNKIRKNREKQHVKK